MVKIISASEVISRKYTMKKASDLNRGADGIPGAPGRDGLDGKVGPQGPAGPASRDGTDGRNGRDGTDGNGFEWKGNYKPENSYEPNDVVHYNGSSYICVKNSKGKPPSGAREFWNLVAEAGSHGGGGGPLIDPTTLPTQEQIARQVIYVTEASQLDGELDSTKLYFIDGEINMGTTSIVVPENGLNIRGHGFGISGLYSTEDNFNLFVTNGVTYSGDLFLTDMDIRISGVGSKVFALDNLENFNACEWNTVNFIACTSLGEIKDYRQGLGRNVAWISCKEGLTMTGAWSGGFAIVDSIVVGAPMTGILFRAGTDLLIGGSFRSNINILGLGTAGGYFTDFAPSNFTLDGGFSLDNVRGNIAVDNTPNMPPSSTKARIKNCVGIPNTYVGGALTPDADSVVSFTTIDTAVQLTSAMTLEENYWFSKANTNGLRSDTTQNIEVVATGTMSFSGQSNDEMAVQLRKWDDSASVYVDIGPEYLTTLNGGKTGTRAENVSFSATTNMDQNDRIEVWIKNVSDTVDISVLAGGQFKVFER